MFICFKIRTKKKPAVAGWGMDFFLLHQISDNGIPHSCGRGDTHNYRFRQNGRRLLLIKQLLPILQRTSSCDSSYKKYGMSDAVALKAFHP